jgi:putative membrane protein
VSYPWLKALHIMGVIAWFAALFYVFRLFVYHVENRDKPDAVAMLEVMERKLIRYIMWPAAVWTTVFGVWLWSRGFYGYLQQPWFHVKLAGLALLFGYHGYSHKVQRDFARGRIELTSRQCRMINEAPTVLMIAIVIMVVVKPSFGGT